MITPQMREAMLQAIWNVDDIKNDTEAIRELLRIIAGAMWVEMEDNVVYEINTPKPTPKVEEIYKRRGNHSRDI